MKCAVERSDIVKKLQELTGATIFEAIQDKKNGCLKSHIKVYKMDADELCIYEDDCEIIDPSYLNLLNDREKYDLMYFGFNTPCNFEGSGHMCSWGTHSMYISAHAKRCFLEYISSNHTYCVPIDHVWNRVEIKYKLRTYRPEKPDIYTRQRPGLVSYITGEVRG